MLWSTVDPTHLAGRLDINIYPFAVLTAVSYRLGDDVAVGGRFVRSADALPELETHSSNSGE